MAVPAQVMWCVPTGSSEAQARNEMRALGHHKASDSGDLSPSLFRNGGMLICGELRILFSKVLYCLGLLL